MIRTEQTGDLLIGSYRSKLKGSTHEFSFDLGKRFYFQTAQHHTISFRPALGLDLLVNNLKGTNETSITGNNPVTYGKTSLTQTYLRFGTDFEYRSNRFALNSGLWYAYDLNNAKLSTTVTSGNFTNKLNGSDLGNSVLSFNIGASYDFGKRITIFAGYNADAYLDRKGSPLANTVYAGYAQKW
jgi:hypothetical protein